MALDKLTLLDETIINNTATSVATTVVNNSAQTNYISFPVATASPTSNGWRVYKDSDAIAPTVGTGGSPNTTLTQNTDTPLNSTGDFRLTKTSSASRRGEGISTDFTIASRHLAKVLQISFDYELISGTLSTDDLRVYIIQDPTGTPVVIEPVNVSIQGSLVSSPTIKLRHLATFQTHISVTSYRLCIHVASTSTSAYTVDFNNFRVWEPSQSIGAIITEPQTYIATIKGGSSDPSKGSNILGESGSWHREGKHLILRYNLRIGTAGSSGTGNYFFLLPSGLSVDYSLVSNLAGLSGLPVIGSAFVSYGSGQVAGSVVLTGASSSFPNALHIIINGSGNVVGQSAYSLGNSDMSYGFQATIPIAGWGSSVAMSSDTGDSRMVAARYTNPTLSSTVLVYQTRDYDTHSAYSNSTGIFTAPINGYYRFSAVTRGSAGSQYTTQIDESNYVTAILDVISTGYSTTITDTVFLRAGQRFRVIIATGSLSSSISSHSFSIERISAGSQTIASSEGVAMHVIKSSGSVGNGTAVTSWTATTLDTHRGFNLTLGEYTIPISGTYFFSGQTADNSGINGTALVRLQTNISGSFADITGTANGMYNTSGSIYYAPHFTHIRRCIAGEKLRLYSSYAGGGSSGIWIDVFFNVARVGI